jgi:hypothetical protein
MPDEFRLRVEATGEMVQAKVVRRKPDEIGLRVL